MIHLHVLRLLLVIVSLSLGFVSAGGFVNAEMFVQVRSATAEFEPGNYFVQHVDTGKYLTFVRQNTVNIRLVSEPATVRFDQVKASGFSGFVRGTYEGTVMSGCKKCASAQYTNKQISAFAAYACRIGSGAEGGNKPSMPVAKQMFAVVKKNNAVQLSSIKPGDASATAAKITDSEFQRVFPPKARLTRRSNSLRKNRKNRKSRGRSGCPKGVICRNMSERKKQEALKHIARLSQKVHSKKGSRKSNTKAKSSSTKNRSNRLEQPSSHSVQLSQKFVSSGKSASDTYVIFALDHLLDMANTRVVEAQEVRTFGGYMSLAFGNLDATKTIQQWRITKAPPSFKNDPSLCHI